MTHVLTQEIKNFYVQRAFKYQKADAFIQGAYWDGFKGCCIGCLAETRRDPHENLAAAMGVPEWIFHLADRIHDGMPAERMKNWPVRFMQAMPIGLDAEAFRVKVQVPFLRVVLQKTLNSLDHEKFPQCTKVIADVLHLYESGETDLEKFKDAAQAAYAAAQAAYAAAQAAYAAGQESWTYFADELLKLMENANND